MLTQLFTNLKSQIFGSNNTNETQIINEENQNNVINNKDLANHHQTKQINLCNNQLAMNDKLSIANQENSDKKSANNTNDTRIVNEDIQKNENNNKDIFFANNNETFTDTNKMSNIQLSINDKILIATQVNSGKKSRKQIADVLNISTMRVNSISRKLKLGNIIYSQSGRPRALDSESDLALRNFIDVLRERNDITKHEIHKQVRKQIKEEYMKTVKRRNKLNENELSQRSLSRYLTYYKEKYLN